MAKPAKFRVTAIGMYWVIEEKDVTGVWAEPAWASGAIYKAPHPALVDVKRYIQSGKTCAKYSFYLDENGDSDDVEKF